MSEPPPASAPGPGDNLSLLLLRHPARAFEALAARPWDRRTLLSHWLFTAGLMAVLGSYYWSRMLLASHALHIFAFWLVFLLLHGALFHLFARALKGKANRGAGLTVTLVSWLPLQLWAMVLIPGVALLGFDNLSLFSEPYIQGVVPSLFFALWFLRLHRVGAQAIYGLTANRARLAAALVALSFVAILFIPNLLLQPDVFLFFQEAHRR
ncbi:MAG: YIP1 family protein [Euryarchaeota archaeon]|nr:YIP1 family protein [Euryarchaeota archaeon]